MASRRISDLHPVLQPMVKELLDKAKFGEWEAFITDGFRSTKEQNALYAQGRTKPGKIVTNAKGGQSLHNFGLAVDIAFKNKRGQAIWDMGLYRKTAKIAKKIGFEWGGDWRSFRDNPHFQYTGGLSLRQVQAGQRPGPKKQDKEFIAKWEDRFILDVEDKGKVYLVFKGERIYIDPTVRIADLVKDKRFNTGRKKLVTGFTNANVLKIPKSK